MDYASLMKHSILLYSPTYGSSHPLISYIQPILSAPLLDRVGALVNDGYREGLIVIAENSKNGASSVPGIIQFTNWNTTGDFSYSKGHYFINQCLMIYTRY